MKNKTEIKEIIIPALDFPSMDETITFLKKIGSLVQTVKIGLQLFAQSGPKAVYEIKNLGFDVFLDLKLHDIPNTVAGAVNSVKDLGVSMLTVHSSGGKEMMRAANEAAGNEITLLAVTLLTSLGEDDLISIAVTGSPQDVVTLRAKTAISAGCNGLVCSPVELEILRKQLGEDPVIVTPGIRPSGSATHDQKRSATPYEAVKNGSDYLVIGRAITQADDPAESINSIQDQIARNI